MFLLDSTPKSMQVGRLPRRPRRPFSNSSLGAGPVSPNAVLARVLPIVVFFFSHQASEWCRSYPDWLAFSIQTKTLSPYPTLLQIVKFLRVSHLLKVLYYRIAGEPAIHDLAGLESGHCQSKRSKTECLPLIVTLACASVFISLQRMKFKTFSRSKLSHPEVRCSVLRENAKYTNF